MSDTQSYILFAAGNSVLVLWSWPCLTSCMLSSSSWNCSESSFAIPPFHIYIYKFFSSHVWTFPPASLLKVRSVWKLEGCHNLSLDLPEGKSRCWVTWLHCHHGECGSPLIDPAFLSGFKHVGFEWYGLTSCLPADGLSKHLPAGKIYNGSILKQP